VNSFLWLLTDFGGVQFFSGNKRRIEIGSIADWQTEGIAYVSADRFFVSCETAGTIDASIYTAAMVFNTTLVKNIGNVPNSDIYPNPTSGILHIDNLQETVTYKVMNMYGQPICSGSMVAGNNEISFENNLPGIYILDIEYKSGGRTAVRFTKQ